MRTKITTGGRARLSNLPPKPSAIAFSYLGQPDCSHNDTPVNGANDNSVQSIMPETSSDSDDIGRCHDLASNTGGEMVVPAKKLCGLGPEDIHEQEDSLEMDWTGKDMCIKCDKGGNVLVCSDSGCPIAVHEKCMGCLARFDDMSNFYCPYCWYKRTIAESHQARKKAVLAKKVLSIFIDKEMTDGDQWKQKTGTARRKEPTLPTVVENLNCCNNENRPDGNDDCDQSARLEENQQEERFAPECTTSILPCNGADASLNDVLLSRCRENAGLNDFDHHRMVVEHQTQSEPIVACGSNGVCCRGEGSTNQFEIVEVGTRVQAEHPMQVDDHEHERVVEDQQEAGNLSASPVKEDTALDGELHVSTKGKRNNAENPEIFEENGGRRAEEEDMQEQALETTVSFTDGEPALLVHSEAKRGVETGDSICRDAENVSSRRSSKRSSSELRSSAVQNEKIITSSKSRQLEEPSKWSNPPFSNVRRKKLPWRDEEEEMLKEGVQKFSTTVNKNLPWRKILEFGRHVFDGTRTPVDLKDKWRNILAKESSKK